MSRADARRTDAAAGAPLEDYLARLDAALATLPPTDRQDILLETRSHVLEQARRAPHRPVGAILAELGGAEDYARQFLPERGFDHAPDAPEADRTALVAPRGWRVSSVTLLGLSRLAADGLLRLPLLMLVLAAYGVAGFAFLLLCAELYDAPGTGIFTRVLPNGDRQVGVLFSDPVPADATDVFGPWFGPMLAAIVAVVVLGVRALLQRVLRDDALRAPHA